MIQTVKEYDLSNGPGSLQFTVQHEEPNQLKRQNPKVDTRVLNFQVISTGLDAGDATISLSQSNTPKGADAIPIDDSTEILIAGNDSGKLVVRDIEANSNHYWLIITPNSVNAGTLKVYLNIII